MSKGSHGTCSCKTPRVFHSLFDRHLLQVCYTKGCAWSWRQMQSHKGLALPSRGSQCPLKDPGCVQPLSRWGGVSWSTLHNRCHWGLWSGSYTHHLHHHNHHHHRGCCQCCHGHFLRVKGTIYTLNPGAIRRTVHAKCQKVVQIELVGQFRDRRPRKASWELSLRFGLNDVCNLDGQREVGYGAELINRRRGLDWDFAVFREIQLRKLPELVWGKEYVNY